MTRPAAAAKRCSDVTTAAVALVLASPLLIAVACAVRVTLGRPILSSRRARGSRASPS